MFQDAAKQMPAHGWDRRNLVSAARRLDRNPCFVAIALLRVVANTSTPRHRLWFEVIAQAVTDLAGACTAKMSIKDWEDAKDYFVSGRFRADAERVDLDPDRILDVLREWGLLS